MKLGFTFFIWSALKIMKLGQHLIPTITLLTYLIKLLKFKNTKTPLTIFLFVKKIPLYQFLHFVIITFSRFGLKMLQLWPNRRWQLHRPWKEQHQTDNLWRTKLCERNPKTDPPTKNQHQRRFSGLRMHQSLLHW
jgi:hypothetical protein